VPSSPNGDATHRIDGVAPASVVRPADVEELGCLMANAHRDKAAVAPWGGGTRTALGNPPKRLDRVVDLSLLDGVVEHSPGDLTATVQAGIPVSRLQDTLREHGQFLAVDPPLPHRATIGGVLAVGASGPLKWQYGSPRDLVMGMKVVAADGTATKSGGKVVKNVSGYDMARLHIGGLGTLGIIAEVSFKLTPLPLSQATVMARYDTGGRCLEAALDVFRGDVVPLAITTFDPRAAALMGVEGDGHTLALRLGGRLLTLERQVAECSAHCREGGASRVDVLGEADAEALWRNLADFGWSGDAADATLARALLLPSRVPELAEWLSRSENAAAPLAVSNPAHGVVLVNWTQTEEHSALAAALRETRDKVHDLGGRLVIERCPLAMKADLDVWDESGEAAAIMRRMKDLYDPRGILNPGRFVGDI